MKLTAIIGFTSWVNIHVKNIGTLNPRNWLDNHY